jgi:hypothetical protein
VRWDEGGVRGIKINIQKIIPRIDDPNHKSKKKMGIGYRACGTTPIVKPEESSASPFFLYLHAAFFFRPHHYLAYIQSHQSPCTLFAKIGAFISMPININSSITTCEDSITSIAPPGSRKPSGRPFHTARTTCPRPSRPPSP